MTNVFSWAIFGLIVFLMLALDLGVFHRRVRGIKMKEALLWSVVWIGVALLFNGGVYWVKGKEAAVQFLTGYVLERSMSFDNLFVFLLVFDYFHLPDRFHHKVLFWGIFGAMIMRAVFIFLGIEAIRHFGWIIYLFGAILIWTGIKLAVENEQKIEPEKNIFIKGFRRFFPITDSYEERKFFTWKNGILLATPLVVVLFAIEFTDVVFAVDSIPAVLAISRDPFIVYTSNIFAILGLRALYLVLAGMMGLFHHLHYGLSLILSLIGVKMLASRYIDVPTAVVLGAILFILAASIIASIIWPRKLKGSSGVSAS